MTTAGGRLPKNILVVDDDEGVRDTLRLALEFEGYNVSSAVNGKDALQVLSDSVYRPCAILLDLMMPIMNGWEFLEVLKKDQLLSKIPVVVLTAYVDTRERLSAQAVLRKPVDLDVLNKQLVQYCANK